MRISPAVENGEGAKDPATSRRKRAPPRLPSSAELWISSLPGLDPASKLALFAGNLPSSTTADRPRPFDSDAHLYFLLARQKHIPKRQRLLLWLNGGPGCSSFDGALMEIGPVRVNADGTLREVSSAWNEYSSVLFLDQPAGTGFSFVTKHDNVRELAPAAQQVVNFLANFYRVFPEFSTVDTYIAGESYAGQWIPYIADAILQSDLSTNLRGLIIGNGWISPREQYPAYLTNLVERGIVKEGSSAYTQVKASVDRCLQTIAVMDAKKAGSEGMVLIAPCEEILGAITAATKKDELCLNLYNTTQYQTCGQEWPEGIEYATSYLRRPDVVKALHAEDGARDKPWEQCSSTVSSHFWTRKSAPSVTLLPKLLESMPILLYNGEQDLMCAGQGVEDMISKLNWNGGVGFNNTETLDWSVDGELAGTWRTERNLTFVSFHGASHMVPIDKPLAAHDMLLRFMQVDTLHAAGPAARVPSRIGSETEAVLGATHPNGTTIKEVEEAVKLEAEAAKLAENDVTDDGFDKSHELQYGPRRTAVLFAVIVFIAVVLWALLRWRGGRRRERYRRLKGKGKAIRLEENAPRDASLLPTSRAEVRSARPSSAPKQQPVQAAEIFDVGEEEEEDDNSNDPDLGGDLGKVQREQNPWA